MLSKGIGFSRKKKRPTEDGRPMLECKLCRALPVVFDEIDRPVPWDGIRQEIELSVPRCGIKQEIWFVHVFLRIKCSPYGGHVSIPP